MGDVMLLGVLRMPYDMAMHSEISRLQLHSRCQEAAASIEADAKALEAAKRENERLRAALKFYADRNRWDEFRDDEHMAAFDRNTGSDLGNDEGEIARAALATDQKGGETDV